VKRKYLSLSGTIAIIHLSVLALLMIYARSFHGNYAENRELLSFMHSASWVLISPFGLFVQANIYRSSFDVCVFVIVIAINSTVIGFIVAWILRRLLSGLEGNTPQRPTKHVSQGP